MALNKNVYPLCVRALNVQDASNLSGVLKSFHETVSELKKLCPELSSAEINNHPVVILFASKVASLTGNDSASAFSKAYNEVKDLQESVDFA